MKRIVSASQTTHMFECVGQNMSFSANNGTDVTIFSHDQVAALPSQMCAKGA